MSSRAAHPSEFRAFVGPRPRVSGRTQVDAVVLRLERWICALQGHDTYWHTDQDRVTLRCVGCGHESPGWSTGRRAYQLTYQGDAARHRLHGSTPSSCGPGR